MSSVGTCQTTHGLVGGAWKAELWPGMLRLQTSTSLKDIQRSHSHGTCAFPGLHHDAV